MPIPDPTRCCFYHLQEYTKNEHVAVLWSGDIVRWAKTSGPEQQWLIVPVDDQKCRIVTRQNGEYMAVGWDGDIIRWAASGKPDQEFSFVNRDSTGRWNIQEGTRNEFVTVGWNGDVVRWAASGKPDQRFKLVPAPGEKPKPTVTPGQYTPGQIPDVPRVAAFGQPPPERSVPYAIGEVLVPGVAVGDPAFSGKVAQVENSPYYVLRREQYWDRSGGRGYYYDIEGAGATTFRDLVKVGFSETQQASIERTLQLQISDGGDFKFGIKEPTTGAEVGATLSVKRQITDGLKVTESTSTTRMTEETREVTVTMPAGRHVRVWWALVDRYSLRRYDGSPVNQWEVVDKGVRVEDSFPD